MTQSSRLAAHRARIVAHDAEPDTPSETDEKGSKQQKDKDMTEEELKAAVAEAEAKAEAKGFAAANTRFAAVTASEHYAGREPLAHALLGNEKLTAEEIIETLSAAEKKPEAPADPGAQRQAAEEAGRKEMQAALSETTNSNLDASGGQAPDKSAQAADVWGSAIAKVFPNSQAN